MDFESRKSEGILRSQKSKQPTQRKPAHVPEIQPVEVTSQERPVSRGRASSKWREGVTQDSLERLAQESARRALELQKKKMVYPIWWQGNALIEKENLMKKADTVKVVNPVRAKVHKKNLARYAEDSLDARLRQVKEDNMMSIGSVEDTMEPKQQTP
jgi:hypothetical protein